MPKILKAGKPRTRQLAKRSVGWVAGTAAATLLGGAHLACADPQDGQPGDSWRGDWHQDWYDARHGDRHDNDTHDFRQVAGDPDPTAVSAPEINPASALSGLTLLVGCLAVLRGRRVR